MTVNKTNTPATFPRDGYSRMQQLLPYLPIAKSTVEDWVKIGKFPKPIKLSATVTAWRNSDIHDWLDSLATGQQTAANDEGGK